MNILKSIKNKAKIITPILVALIFLVFSLAIPIWIDTSNKKEVLELVKSGKQLSKIYRNNIKNLISNEEYIKNEIEKKTSEV